MCLDRKEVIRTVAAKKKAKKGKPKPAPF